MPARNSDSRQQPARAPEPSAAAACSLSAAMLCSPGLSQVLRPRHAERTVTSLAQPRPAPARRRAVMACRRPVPRQLCRHPLRRGKPAARLLASRCAAAGRPGAGTNIPSSASHNPPPCARCSNCLPPLSAPPTASPSPTPAPTHSLLLVGHLWLGIGVGLAPVPRRRPVRVGRLWRHVWGARCSRRLWRGASGRRRRR